MKLNDVLKDLKSKGSEQTRKTLARHGASESYGVKVADLKVVAKKIKGRQDLAHELFETGNYDAMYLAGMVADGREMTKKQLESWARNARFTTISEYSVPWVASESKHGRDLAMKWIDARKEQVAAAGWCTYVGLLATQADEELDLDEVRGLLKRVQTDIADAPNRVRYTMNGFVIAVGSYVQSLRKEAKATAKSIGKVEVDMGGTACKVPLATEYIDKVEKAGRAGKKRKTIRC